MKKENRTELRILKTVLWLYILLCFIIAGLNYGYAKKATPEVAKFIYSFWHFYENWIKTIIIIICSFLTIRIIRTSQDTTMRKRNLIGFTVAAFIVHIITPILLHNKEIYFFTMPLPWTTTPLQLLYTDTSFYQSRVPIWGVAGITAALIVYICYSAFILIGTMLFGRRLQCSTLCLFNGFAAEVFAPAFPLVGKKKETKPYLLKVFGVLRWVFFIGALLITTWWILFLLGVQIPGNHHFISGLETVRYLCTELLLAMFFWVVLMGRGYCHYCPLGTILALYGRAVGQQISSDETKCIQCGKCNRACPMTIDIKTPAKTAKPSKDIRCVGCGHCVDVCPTKTLRYTTAFLSWIKKRKSLGK